MQEPSQNTYIPDPEAEIEALVQAFLSEIRQHITDPAQAEVLTEAIQAQQVEILAASQHWLVDEPATYNLKMTTVVLAAYRVLQEVLPQNALFALLREAFIKPTRDSVREATTQMLDAAPDPLHALAEVSKFREEHFYGTGFTFEHERDDHQASLVNVRRCLYHDFFVANGAPELTPIFCDFDANWIDAIDPARHGVRFERATTMGYGGTMCPFHFYRIERTSRK